MQPLSQMPTARLAARPSLPLWMTVAVILLAVAAVPHVTVRWGWRDALFDLLGLSSIMGGTLLVMVAQEQAERRGLPSLLVGLLALCAGVDLLVHASAQSALWMVVFLVVLGSSLGLGGTRDWPRCLPTLSAWCSDGKRYAVTRGTLLCGVVALTLTVELLQVALFTPGGPKAHPLELGTLGVLLSLVGVAWAASTDALRVFIQKPRPPDFPAAALGSNFVVCSLALFGSFLLLFLTIQAPPVQEFDVAVARLAFQCWDQPATQVVRQVSKAGGRDLALLWIPGVLLLFALGGRGHALRFFTAVMFGTLGLETVFKELSHRLRPEFTRGAHFDSFPSGHTLAATILAGLLLVLLLPTCRRRWQRVSLWAVAPSWPLLMAFSRVYTGRHYLTDVMGALLLGGAWVCFCTGLFFWLTEAGFGGCQPLVARREESR